MEPQPFSLNNIGIAEKIQDNLIFENEALNDNESIISNDDSNVYASPQNPRYAEIEK